MDYTNNNISNMIYLNVKRFGHFKKVVVDLCIKKKYLLKEKNRLKCPMKKNIETNYIAILFCYLSIVSRESCNSV